MSRVHGLIGWSTLLIFLLTGAYLRWIFPEAYADDPSTRYLFRANHVYILFSSLLNILSARTLSRTPFRPALSIMNVGSALLVLCPFFFLAAFIIETSPATPERPLTVVGAFSALIGIVLLYRATRQKPL